MSFSSEPKSSLMWGAMYQPLEARALQGDPLILLISPFIGLTALKRFLQSVGNCPGTKIIARWRPEDILSGSSDIEIYPYLRELGIPLYVHFDIHLKLYVFASNTAFSTSGNLTLRGFGYSDKSNIEVGGFVHLGQADWLMLYDLIAASRLVDNDMYKRYQIYLKSCDYVKAPLPPLPDFYGVVKRYTISSLPAVETPLELSKYYSSGELLDCDEEQVRRVAHDLVVFNVPAGLKEAEFWEVLGESFLASAFVMEFIELLRGEKSLRFGAVNDWIHYKCEDVPLPYRWEIKGNTNIFYNWLAHFVPEITWDRPNYSQVIYWQKQ